MGIDLDNGFRDLKAHLGHRIVIVQYGTFDDIWNIALECESCDEVLIDFDNPKLTYEPEDVGNFYKEWRQEDESSQYIDFNDYRYEYEEDESIFEFDDYPNEDE